MNVLGLISQLISIETLRLTPCISLSHARLGFHQRVWILTLTHGFKNWIGQRTEKGGGYRLYGPTGGSDEGSYQ
jgi:hypothetical protein